MLEMVDQFELPFALYVALQQFQSKMVIGYQYIFCYLYLFQGITILSYMYVFVMICVLGVLAKHISPWTKWLPFWQTTFSNVFLLDENDVI